MPYVNYGLIALNVLVFGLEALNGACFQIAYSEIPAAILAGQPAQIQGCPYGQPSPVWITLFTSMFLHANLLHIAGNMLYLWIFGDNVEDRLGHIGYLVFYLFCGLAADAAQITFDPSSTVPNLGASGAIAGVLGAYLVFYPGSRVRTLVFLGFFVTIANLSAVIVIGLWFVLQVVSGVAGLGSVQQGGVAYFAHIGGFVAGAAIALLLRLVLKPPAYPVSYPNWPVHPELRDADSS